MKPERVRKKRNIIFIIAVMIVGAFVLKMIWPFMSTSTRFDLDELREECAEHYEGGMLIHTVNLYGCYYDFVVKENEEHVVRIRSFDTLVGEAYQIGATHSGPLLYNVPNNVTNYLETGKLSYDKEATLELALHRAEKQVKWCFMDTTPVEPEEGVDAYPFEHEGKEYVLYIKVENNE